MSFSTLYSPDLFGDLAAIKIKSKRLDLPPPRPLFPPLPLDERPVYIGQRVYIRPSYIVSLSEYSSNRPWTSLGRKLNEKNLTENQHQGRISRKAVMNLKNAINWMICGADIKKVYCRKKAFWFNYKVGFVTLTLPDTKTEISNKDFQTKLLNPWLTYMRMYHGLKNYVWKLEFQKNGKLHCHVTFDVFVHHKKLRHTWNRLLAKNGYMADFYLKFGHSSPNSTDIHSVKKVRNLGAYLCKYMSKSCDDLEKIKGRIWGCSTALSRANKTSLFIDRDATHFDLAPLMHKKIKYQSIGVPDAITGEFKKFGEVFFLTYKNWVSDIHGSIKDAFCGSLNLLKNSRIDLNLTYEV